MKLFEFTTLERKSQIDHAYKGAFLAKRVQFGDEISLYNLEDFYVELYFSTALNKIVKVRAFSTTKLIQPYLDQISGEDFIDLV